MIVAIAYAVLVEEQLGEPVKQAPVRYPADNVTVLLDIDDTACDDLQAAIRRARALRKSTERPPVTENIRLCPKCLLAVVCLPEEDRLAFPIEQIDSILIHGCGRLTTPPPMRLPRSYYAARR